MSTLRTLKKLVLGETWVLPVGLAAVVLAGALVVRPLVPHAWTAIGGFLLLGGVVAVLVASVALGVRRGSGSTAVTPSGTRAPRAG